MKNFLQTSIITLGVIASLLGGTVLQAQQETPDSAPANPVVEWNSPLHHLDRPTALTKTANTRPWNCVVTSYYNKTTNPVSISDSTPTHHWAMRMSLPTLPAVTKCTVWTVGINFRWVPQQPGKIDTMHIFMREVTAPYNQFYHSRYLMKLGENLGEVEIDPPIPGNTRPIINPKRDVYIGLYLTGQTGSQVTWRMKTPSQYSNPLRSVIFSNGVPVGPGAVVGTSGDWVFDAVPCCNFSIPVELSTFTGQVDGEHIALYWRTESETNNFQFEVQRSLHPQGPWESRGAVPGQGTSLMPQDYSFRDFIGSGERAPAYWYRLKQMDFDGTVSEIPAIRVATAAAAAGFVLHTPYPSPISLSGYTTIAYELPVEAPVTMEVFDALGRKIATLVDRVVPAGYHEALWYPVLADRQLKEGTYFMRVATNTFVATRKVTLLR